MRVSCQIDNEVAYVSLVEVAAGSAVVQKIVQTPDPLNAEIVLDFDAKGRLLGIEFLDSAALPIGPDGAVAT